jgi:hypothetical protein
VTTVAENLRAKVLADTTVSARIADRMSYNRIPQSEHKPYIWFTQSGSSHDVAMDDAAGGPNRRMFDLECVSPVPEEARMLIDAVQAALNNHRGTFGDSTCQAIFATEQDDQYVPRSSGGDDGLHACALLVEVVS